MIRFKQFIEDAGYYDDKDTSDQPTLVGNPLKLPNMEMSLGKDRTEGVVTSIEDDGNQVKMTIKSVDGQEKEINAPSYRFRRHGKAMPKTGNRVTLIMDRDGMLVDYRIDYL